MCRALAFVLLLTAALAQGPARVPPDDTLAEAMQRTDVLLRLVKDGRPEEAAAHVDAAAALLRSAVEQAPDRAAFAQRWRTTVDGLLIAFGAPGLSRRLRDDMLWLKVSWRTDASDTAFRQGLGAEIRAGVAGPLSGAAPAKAVALSKETRGELATAARNYEDALAADPA